MIEIPYGHCHCGCGQKTNLARATVPRDGWVKGEPLRYVMNHHRRRPQEYVVEDHGYLTPCWIWTGTIEDGYGRITQQGFRRAHVLYYVKAKGPVPEGLEIDHLCRNRACVNPDHLEAVPRQVNVQRGYKARGKPTHCKHGHEFTPRNTIVSVEGWWRCRICDNANQRRYYYKRAAKTGVKPRKRIGSD